MKLLQCLTGHMVIQIDREIAGIMYLWKSLDSLTKLIIQLKPIKVLCLRMA